MALPVYIFHFSSGCFVWNTFLLVTYLLSKGLLDFLRTAVSVKLTIASNFQKVVIKGDNFVRKMCCILRAQSMHGKYVAYAVRFMKESCMQDMLSNPNSICTCKCCTSSCAKAQRTTHFLLCYLASCTTILHNISTMQGTGS